MRGDAAPGGYDPRNSFYRSPDTEILYLMVRSRKPKRIVEIGSGNSTRVVRQAIYDGGIDVEHFAIDPEPRSDITGLVDKIQRARFEDADGDADAILSELESNDIVFIDSSHAVRAANDVAKLFCTTIPALPPGVIVHVHDIFLPFDYPEPFCTEHPDWGEQYLLQVLLQGSQRKVLWPGYYVQKMRPELHSRLPFIANGPAQSFWFEV